MLGDKVKVTISDGIVFIENISNEIIDDGFIEVNNIFYCSILRFHFKLLISETTSIPLGTYAFSEFWDGEALYVKVYNRHKLIFKKEFFDKTKCFVILSNKPFQKLTEQLIIGLRRYSNVDILHYTINYDSSLKYDYLYNIKFNLNGDTNDPQYMQFAKPPVLLNVLERGYKFGVFLDADIQVRSNIDGIFSYINHIDDGPILQKGVWDYTIAHGTYIPGPMLSEFMELPPQTAPQGITNVMIFSDKHYDLFKEWERICFSEEIQYIRQFEFLHDELIFNCLTWKHGVKLKLFYFAVNVVSTDDIEFIYNHKNVNYENYTNLNDFNLGRPFQSIFPYDTNELMMFHCVKDVEIAKQINQLVYLREFKKSDVMNTTIYDNVPKNPDIKKQSKPIFDINYINGVMLSVSNSPNTLHRVSFIDKKTGHVEYSNVIENNSWARAAKQYFVDWKTRIEYNDAIYEHDLDYTGKTVYIALESKSIGDTIAWFPYIDAFGKKHNCDIICSTFHNELFRRHYPHIKFINPGEVAHNIAGMYCVGWYYNDSDSTVNFNKVPYDFKQQNLQKTASDILGLDFEEIKPVITDKVLEKSKQICIAIHSTSQAKYWNNPTGWQDVVDWCNLNGYTVRLLSRENDGYMGNTHPTGVIKHPDGSIESVIDELLKSEAFIGIGSGLSWLSWAVNTPTLLVSGFSYDYTEPSECHRLTPPNGVCSGCFNRYRLDASDWNWCPDHKGTSRQFECTKSITSEMVIAKLKSILS